MATKISAVMTVTNQTGTKETSRSITDISPTANPNAVVDFVRGLNGLTNNILKGVELVTKTDILSTYDPKDPRLTVTPNTAVLDSAKMTFDVSFRGNGTITLSGKKPNDTAGGFTYNANDKQLVKGSVGGLTPKGPNTYTTTINLSATEDYSAATATITWTNADTSMFTDI